jgi:Secretion system C-terminal sorting domain
MLSNVRFDKMEADNRRLNTTFFASPTPTKDATTLNFTLEERGNVLIEVFSIATGQRVFIQNQVFAKGQNQVFVDLSPFANGIYMTQMTQTKGRAITKIVKQ